MWSARATIISSGVGERGRSMARTGNGDAAIAALIAQTPLGRMSDPDEIAAVALFLASDESGFMIGSETSVDGGIAQV
jgi:NAD(P)-dependent dehydrogenase (short-subunit alcohol dehydrogenase family)